jgi:hypothetical protein
LEGVLFTGKAFCLPVRLKGFKTLRLVSHFAEIQADFQASAEEKIAFSHGN